ncbi:CYTH and CHAD domain-containing protein [Streptomyces sp. SPB074]|uniref:CYTH and CHAD domain-containing protein n=1 Tax=Streptomyces sp. (strain SPB074) TaxID=465543 RepID=UPI0001D1E2F8|nr:CYTH and CHAD domain-containing protein [Streptomyces sp. SPB074]EFG65313.1 adenylate cyclase [Streptomyces sp. SPB074]
MATATHETERKYDLDPGTPLPALTAVRGVHEEGAPRTHHLDAVYYDTADLRLARTRATLRRRTGGADAGWHLKLPVAGDTREEVRLPLDADDEPGGPVPEELARLVTARTRGAALVPVVRLATRRTTRLLYDARGAALAEIAHDEVHARRLGRSRATARWSEIETELTGAGTPALLDAVEKRLREAGIHRATGPSKLVRALTETGTPPSPLVPPAAPDTAGGHLLRHLRAQYLAFLGREAAFRQDRPDAVHKARVALRRTRAALRGRRPLLDREATDALRAELRWLARELGADRDREVLEERLRGLLAEAEGPLLLGPAEARLTTWAVRAGDTSRATALAALDSPRCRALLDAWDAFLAAPPLTGKAARPAPEHFRAVVRKERRRARRHLADALALPQGPARDAALHEARKKTKRLRYAAESARPVLGKPAKRRAREAKALTSLLGDHHDGVVARAALRELAARAHAAGEPGFTWGLLHGREEARARAYESALERGHAGGTPGRGRLR